MSNVFYRPLGSEVEVFRHGHTQMLPLLLKGPTGCGKTRFVEYMAEQLDLPLITVSCNEDTSATDLLGRFLIKGGETIWVDGPVVRAIRTGSILYLDEIAEARPDALVVIHSLTDHRRELYLDRTGETVKAPSAFMLVASFNPGYQRSMRELKQSTRQRFISMSFAYPNATIESEIITIESGIDIKNAARLVGLGNKIRSLTELSLLESVSTRLLVSAGKLIHAGTAPRLACKVAIVEPLSDDIDTVAALNDVVELVM